MDRGQVSGAGADVGPLESAWTGLWARGLCVCGSVLGLSPAGPLQGRGGCYRPQGWTAARSVLFLENEANGTGSHSQRAPVLPSVLACRRKGL